MELLLRVHYNVYYIDAVNSWPHRAHEHSVLMGTTIALICLASEHVGLLHIHISPYGRHESPEPIVDDSLVGSVQVFIQPVPPRAARHPQARLDERRTNTAQLPDNQLYRLRVAGRSRKNRLTSDLYTTERASLRRFAPATRGARAGIFVYAKTQHVHYPNVFI